MRQVSFNVLVRWCVQQQWSWSTQQLIRRDHQTYLAISIAGGSISCDEGRQYNGSSTVAHLMYRSSGTSVKLKLIAYRCLKKRLSTP
eukprot:14101-Heterococcus_DN1.PRE.3